MSTPAKKAVQLSQEDKTLRKNWKKYKGNIVMVVNDKIFATKKSSDISKYVKKIEKEYGKRPLIAVIPREDSLILFL